MLGALCWLTSADGMADKIAAQIGEEDRLVILMCPRNLGDVAVVRKVGKSVTYKCHTMRTFNYTTRVEL